MKIFSVFMIFFILLISVVVYAGECKDYIELNSVKFFERKYKKSSGWVVNNIKINLWEKSTPQGNGKSTGTLVPGSKALIIEIGPEDYKVITPREGSVGWVNKMYVNGILKLDTETMNPCK